MKNPFLVGEKVYLRPLEETDAPAFQPWFNDPDVRRTIGSRAYPESEAVARRFVQSIDAETEQHFAIVERADDVHVGNCELSGIAGPDRCATLGIVIGRRDRWGRGLGTEAVRLLCHHAFVTLNLHKVSLSCDAINERALRVYARVGFRVEGRRRDQSFIEGKYVDEVVMGLLRGEFEHG